jgi:hypothetical protein
LSSSILSLHFIWSDKSNHFSLLSFLINTQETFAETVVLCVCVCVCVCVCLRACAWVCRHVNFKFWTNLSVFTKLYVIFQLNKNPNSRRPNLDFHTISDKNMVDTRTCDVRSTTAPLPSGSLTFLTRNYFFLVLAHPVYKMRIIQEPNTIELWNKLHFEEEKRRVYTMFKIFGTSICWINT